LSLISNISKVNKIMVWLETPNNHHQPLHILKLYDNTPFHNSIDTHAGTINHQVTITFMENQQGLLLIILISLMLAQKTIKSLELSWIMRSRKHTDQH